MLPGVDCAKSTAPDHTNLEVTKIKGALTKVRRLFIVPGFSPEVKFLAFNNTVQALEKALKERVYFVKDDKGTFVAPPTPLTGVFKDKLKSISEAFGKHRSHVTRLTYQQYVDTSPPHKRTVYQRAMESLNNRSITIKDSFIGFFAKFEKLKYSPLKTPVPRGISPRSPRYNLELGTYIRPIEKSVYAVINKLFESPTVMKGLNMSNRGQVIALKWARFRSPVALMLDAHRFDQHVSVEALKWAQSIYRKYFPRSKHFRKLLKWQLRNRGFGKCEDGFVKYWVDGRRQSGDVNTSLGNVLIMCAIVFSLFEENEIDGELVNDGDDCVLIFESSELDRLLPVIPNHFLLFGFSVVIEKPVYVLEHISFCQAQPVYDGTDYIMVRDPHISISKDCISLKPLDSDKITKRWAAAIGLGGISMTGGIPIVQEFYQSLVRSSEGARPLEDVSLRRYNNRGLGMHRLWYEPTAESRLSFWLAFGIPPSAQTAIEDVYRNSRIGKVGVIGVDHEQMLPYL